MEPRRRGRMYGRRPRLAAPILAGNVIAEKALAAGRCLTARLGTDAAFVGAFAGSSSCEVRRVDRLRLKRKRPVSGAFVSGFRLGLGALLGHLRAFLALRLSGALRRRGYLLLARHLGFSPVSRRGLSGRRHDVLLMSCAVMALSTIGGVLARIKSRKNDD